MGWLRRLKRLLQHRRLDAGDSRRLLGEPAVLALQQRIQASERLHSGELRVVIEAGLPNSYLMRDATARERAVALFQHFPLAAGETNRNELPDAPLLL